MMAYHQFKDENGEEYGSFEVFWNDQEQWFWWPCWPGCLPDCDEPIGPFYSEDEALSDALMEQLTLTLPH